MPRSRIVRSTPARRVRPVPRQRPRTPRRRQRGRCAARRSAGSDTAARTTLCRRSTGPSTGTMPSPIAAASRPVSSTTRTALADPLEDLRHQHPMVGLDQDGLDVGERVDEGGQHLGGRGPQHARPAPRDRPRCRSTRSPARDASAASSRAASIAWSSFGWSPTRPADVRPVSSTISTCRSRSGRQVRTTTVLRPGRAAPVDRADVVAGDVLAQAVELGALPALQDAWPGRPARAAGPAGWAGACDAVNGGSTRIVHGAGCWRLPAGEPSGPSARIDDRPGAAVTAAGGQQRQLDSRRRCRAGMSTGWTRRARRPTAARRRGRAAQSTPAGVGEQQRCWASSPSRTECRRARRCPRRATGAASRRSPAAAHVAIGTGHHEPHDRATHAISHGASAPARQVSTTATSRAPPRHRGSQRQVPQDSPRQCVSSA